MGSSRKSRSNQIERGLGHIELQFERGDTVGRVTGIGRSPGAQMLGAQWRIWGERQGVFHSQWGSVRQPHSSISSSTPFLVSFFVISNPSQSLS